MSSQVGVPNFDHLEALCEPGLHLHLHDRCGRVLPRVSDSAFISLDFFSFVLQTLQMYVFHIVGNQEKGYVFWMAAQVSVKVVWAESVCPVAS